jgi:hypothetical protein
MPGPRSSEEEGVEMDALLVRCDCEAEELTCVEATDADATEACVDEDEEERDAGGTPVEARTVCEGLVPIDEVARTTLGKLVGGAGSAYGVRSEEEEEEDEDDDEGELEDAEEEDEPDIYIWNRHRHAC